jgi:predicted aspartyl protease
MPYERDGVPRPVMKVEVSDPRRRSRADVLTRVDTGFNGGLLIPLDQYVGLRLQEYEEPSSTFVARSAQGITVSLRSSRGIATVEGRASECSVYTTPLLLRPLLGRELLNRWKVTLDGPKTELALH